MRSLRLVLLPCDSAGVRVCVCVCVCADGHLRCGSRQCIPWRLLSSPEVTAVTASLMTYYVKLTNFALLYVDLPTLRHRRNALRRARANGEQ